MRAGRRRVLAGAATIGMVMVVAIAGMRWNAGDEDERTLRPATQSERADAGPQPIADANAGAAAAVVATAPAAMRVMSGPFRDGRLPDALPAVRGNPDTAAATLAAFIAARDGQSVPALLTALEQAGFAVRHEDGRVLPAAAPGQGLVFDAWEVAAMAKLYGERRTMPWSQLGEDLRLATGLRLDPLLRDGIVEHANGKQPQLRFWARLIVELGKHAAAPYDLLAVPDPRDVELDAVQTSLILRRLFGDLAGAARPALEQRGAARGFVPDAVPGDRWTRVTDAVPARLQAAASDPCAGLGSDDTSTILDIAATTIGTGWGAILDSVSQQVGDAADRYARFLSIANTLLAYGKLLLTYASIETEITMADPPLVRTTNATAGERRQLTATVTVDSGGFSRYNCVRTALNVATGMDFSLIDDGPLGDVELTWRVDNPGENYYSNSTGVTGNRPVVGITSGGARIQDAGTYAGVGGAGVAVGDNTRSRTDENGRARIFLEGTPRVPYLPKPHMPVMKDAVVRTNLRLKGGDVKGDAVDIAGQALGGVGALATLPVELLFRVPWASYGQTPMSIRDWETCTSEEWYGSITSSTRYLKTNVEEFEGGDAMKRSDSRYSYDATISVSGEGATGSVTSTEAFDSDQQSGYGRITLNRIATASYSGAINVSIYVNPRAGTYDVGFEAPPLTGTSRTTGSCERPSPLRCQQPSPRSIPWDGGRYLSSVSGTIAPDDPTRIDDTKTITRGDTEHTFTVSLQRCR